MSTLGNAAPATPVDGDRRREPRTEITINCTYVTRGGDIVGAHTRDLSPSGVAVNADRRPAKGSSVHLHFDGFGVHAGTVTRLFDGGFAVSLPTSSLAVLALEDE